MKFHTVEPQASKCSGFNRFRTSPLAISPKRDKIRYDCIKSAKGYETQAFFLFLKSNLTATKGVHTLVWLL